MILHILVTEGGNFVNNLDRFMKTCSTILGLISKFQLFTKKCKFLFFFIFAETALTISRMDFFGLLIDLWGGKKGTSLKSVAHILHWWNLAVITYLKKVQKIHRSCETLPEFCWHQPFFTGNQQFLVYQQMQV